MKVTVILVIISALDTVIKMIGEGAGGLGNKRTIGDHSNYSIAEIGYKTEWSPGGLKGLVVTQTPVRNHQLSLVGKTLKRKIIPFTNHYHYHHY